MIKIGMDLPDLDQLAESHFKMVENNFDIPGKFAARPSDELDKVLEYITTHLKKIITARPAELEQLDIHLSRLSREALGERKINNPLDKPKNIKKWHDEGLLSILNYSSDHLSFTRRYDGRNAYAFVQSLNVPACLYCNCLFTFTIDNDQSKARPELDHFFNKADHPWFAMSFYNLVPSCNVCNASLKGGKNFMPSTHIHPYEASFLDVFDFYTGIHAADFVRDKKDFELTFRPAPGADPALVRKAERNAEVFALRDRYGFLKYYAGQIITMAYVYEHSQVKSLLEDYTVNGRKLFASESEIEMFLLSNTTDAKQLHTRVLSKLTRDVMAEHRVNLRP